MPWFAWLFLGLVTPVVVWWLIDEHHYRKHQLVRTEDTLTALARAVGVYKEETL